MLLMALLICFAQMNLLLAQSKTVAGKITDATGNPVAGASVIVKQSSTGTSTDADGRFRLMAPVNASLVISYAGFKSQTIKVGDIPDDFQLKLTEDIGHLDEVVVTGLTTSVKRRNLANSVATISSKELNGVAPAQTFDAALEGKIPGAYINSNTGAPGGGISVKLRGVTSIFGNTQPLYVVDGVFMDNTATSAGLNAVTSASANGSTSSQDNPSSRIADLRSEDVENIEILKGASAAAIYGSRAAAGVVIITTKRGRQGRTKVSFSQDLGYVQARRLLGVRQFTEQTAASLASDSAASAALVAQFKAAKAAGKLYDYEKEMFGETGFTTNSVVSVSGGTEKTSFYFSGAYKKEDGIVKRTGYRNASFRLNVDHRITDNIKIGISTNYINSSSDRGLTGNDNAGVSFGIALSSTPQFAELHPDASGIYPKNTFAASNPLQTRDLMTNNEGVNRFVTGLNIEAILQKSARSNTKIIGRGGVDFYSLRTDAQFPVELQFQTVNQGTSIQGFTTNINTNYIASLVNTFTPSEKLSFTTSLGMTQENGSYDNLLNVATHVIPGQSNVNQASALTATQFRNKFQNTGFFVQEEASIIDAITLTAGVRFDKSTNNGDPDKYYAYPKAGLAWNISRMDFWKSDLIENLKIRAAYGQAGNFPAYGSKFTSLVNANIDGSSGLVVDLQRGNPAIQPERQTEFEAGLDFSVLKGRLNFEFTWYNKTVYDFLMQNTAPTSSGFSTGWVNAGDLRNQGIELGLNAQPISNRNFRWNTTVNFWLNQSLVTKLNIPPVSLGSFGTTLGTFRIEQGKSATQIVGIGGPGGTVVAWGNQEPKFQMNSFNEFTYRNKLTLRFLLHWKYKGDNVNLTTLQNDFGGTSPDWDKVTNKLGVPDGLYRIMQVGTSAQEFVQNAGYFRLREIGLYYTFTMLHSNVVKGLRLGVSLSNFLTLTKYYSYDPEVSNFGTGFSTGVDVDPYPASKRAEFHLSLDF